MPGLFHNLETMASKGAEGLAPDARKTLFDALVRLRPPDAYYAFFAWLCLRALDPSAPEIAAVERHLLTCPTASPIDALCARLVKLNAAPSALTRLRALFFVARNPPRDVYASFLHALTLDVVFARGIPRPVKRLIGKRLHVTPDAPTPRLAAKLTLTSPGHPDCDTLKTALLQRRRPTGGFVSSANAASPDLLATAVARFALMTHAPTGLTPEHTAADLAFTEACWADDALFAPLPYSTRGDAEYTFYALLSLGTGRWPSVF